MSEIKNGRLGLCSTEHSKCNHLMTLGFKGLNDHGRHRYCHVKKPSNFAVDPVQNGLVLLAVILDFCLYIAYFYILVCILYITVLYIIIIFSLSCVCLIVMLRAFLEMRNLQIALRNLVTVRLTLGLGLIESSLWLGPV